MTTMIRAHRILTGTTDLGAGWVRLDGPTVADLGPGDPPEVPDVVLPTGVLAPGLIDAQVNGAFGVDLAGADVRAWHKVVRSLPRTGVTAFVPTFTTDTVPRLAAALNRLRRLRPGLAGTAHGARVLPAHLEGPFLSALRRGAHPAELLQDPTPPAIDALVAAGTGGVLGCLTLAPERSGAVAAVEQLTGHGVRVAVGHSDADEACVHAAADAGATLVTHLYNAQRPLHHRDPGVVGAALVDDRLTCGLIVDGHHVEPAAVRIAFACKPGRIMLVTDAVAALGMPEGRYVLGGQEVVLREGEPPRRHDGTVAGAAGRLDDAIGRAVAAGIPLQDAVEAATRVPATAVGRPDLGRLTPGAPADLVWLDAEGEHPLRAQITWIAGTVAARSGPRLEGDSSQ
jgi:N-acetylglucosamine-6-phosphate deacetylase